MRRPRRWLHVGAAAGTAAHHGFELAAGVGLVFQPYLGLGGSAALWGASLPAWVATVWWASARARRRAAGPDDAPAERVDHLVDGTLAFLVGVSIAGALLHFKLWPVERRPRGRRLGLPVLVEAEGLSPRQLPTYNAVLYVWGIASVAALIGGTPRGSRRWAAPGLVAAIPLTWSARHHFAWLAQQARDRPAWWNRAPRQGAVR
jgi:hypothetical protein